MAIENILGSAGIVVKGDYSASTTYNYLNIVTQNKHWYICQIRGGITNLPPAATFINNTQWVKFVEGLDNYVTGITGPSSTGDVVFDITGSANITIKAGHQLGDNLGWTAAAPAATRLDADSLVAYRQQWNLFSEDIAFYIDDNDDDKLHLYFPKTQNGTTGEVGLLYLSFLGGIHDRQDTHTWKKLSGTSNEIVLDGGTTTDPVVFSLSTAITGIIDKLPSAAQVTAATDGQIMGVSSGAMVIQDAPISGATQIANATDYETARVAGFVTGEFFTPSASFSIIDVVGSKSKMVITAGADTMAANSRVVFTAANAEKMFPITTQPVPALNATFSVFIGTNTDLGLPDNEAWGTAENTDSFIMFPAIGPGSTLAKATWLTNIAASINGVSTDTAGAVSGNDAAGITTATAMYRLGVATVVGDTVEIETLVNASLGTLPQQAVGGDATYTYTDGTADTYIAEFTEGYLYQRTAAGGWFEYDLDGTVAANAKV